MKIKNTSLSLVLLLVFSCSKKSPELDVAQVELNKAQDLWRSKGIDSYSYTQTRFCFCLPKELGPHKLTILNGVIVSVNGEAFDASIHQGYLNINDSFEYIINKLENDPEEISLEFDSTYGFPTDVFFDMSLMIADEEIRLTFTGFIPSSANK